MISNKGKNGRKKYKPLKSGGRGYPTTYFFLCVRLPLVSINKYINQYSAPTGICYPILWGKGWGICYPLVWGREGICYPMVWGRGVGDMLPLGVWEGGGVEYVTPG